MHKKHNSMHNPNYSNLFLDHVCHLGTHYTKYYPTIHLFIFHFTYKGFCNSLWHGIDMQNELFQSDALIITFISVYTLKQVYTQSHNDQKKTVTFPLNDHAFIPYWKRTRLFVMALKSYVWRRLVGDLIVSP